MASQLCAKKGFNIFPLFERKQMRSLFGWFLKDIVLLRTNFAKEQKNKTKAKTQEIDIS